MLLFAWYVLKVIICSGILYAYYSLALRDRLFHKWNRFYLLAAVILSLAAPLIKIDVFQNAGVEKTRVVEFLQVVNGSDEFVFEYSKGGGSYHLDVLALSTYIYAGVSLVIFSLLIITLFKINKIKKDSRPISVEGINLINTTAKGTPFSFFNIIFWNEKIDISTATGKRIFKHELAHVQEKHSYDKVFMNIVLIGLWSNPFFWLIRKELSMIHEFIADKIAMEDSDTATFAAMILQASYPQHQFNITNNFFYSPVKRRLIMLTKNNNPTISYVSRLLVLPLAAIIFFAFTVRMKTPVTTHPYTGKTITVVIDAGHGGDDGGAKSDNGIYEKNLTLSIAQKVKELNKNKNLNVILLRDKDQTISVKQRAEMAKSLKADLFISLHIDAEPDKITTSGFSILIPNNDNPYLAESKLLGSTIYESFKNNYKLSVANNLKQPKKGIWVLKANQCPAVLLQPGFIDNHSDLEYLTNPANQQIIAKNILNGVEKYASGNMQAGNKVILITEDTMLPTQKGGIFVDTKSHIWLTADTLIYTTEPNHTHINISKAVIIVNGKIENIDMLRSKTIVPKKLIIHSGDEKSMIAEYGESAKNGVLVFEGATIINKPNHISDTTILKNLVFFKEALTNDKSAYSDNIRDEPKNISDKIFTKVEIEAEFPGGQQAWLKYIEAVIQKSAELLIKDRIGGTCIIQFVVSTTGEISDVKAINMENSKLAEIGINAMKTGPKWIPAKQNNQLVASYKKQAITFNLQDNIVNREPE